MSRDGRLLMMCDVTTPVPACSTVACAYHAYRDVAWQCIDQICHNTEEYSDLAKDLLSPPKCLRYRRTYRHSQNIWSTVWPTETNSQWKIH
jgi:hypothetical protein